MLQSNKIRSPNFDHDANRRLCILSDSMSMISKINAGHVRKQWMQSLSTSSLRQVTFIYVPGHAGVQGNESADRLAGSANITEGQPMDRADIINALRESFRAKEFDGCVSTSVIRMRECGLRVGTARRENFRRRLKAMINQHRTGTISHATLIELLRRRSEHLWICPECNDDNLET